MNPEKFSAKGTRAGETADGNSNTESVKLCGGINLL